MSISFTCHACGKTVRAPDNAAGRIGKCPTCNAELTIPSPEYFGEASLNAGSDTEDNGVLEEKNSQSVEAGTTLSRTSVNPSNNRRTRKTLGRSAYDKAVTMHDCGLNRESQLVLIDLIFSQDANDADKSAAMFLLGSISYEENRISAALKSWRQLIEVFPDSDEARLVRDRLVELAEVVSMVRQEYVDNAIAQSYLSHAEFWSRGKDEIFTIDTSWIGNVEAAVKWYNKTIREFPGSLAARLAYEGKLRALMGWIEPGEYGSSHGMASDFGAYLPQVLSAFSEFEVAFPDAPTLQAFRFQIGQVYWAKGGHENAEIWFNKILAESGDGDSFYSDLATRRLLKLKSRG